MQDWQKLGEETVYSGYRTIVRKKFRLPDNTEADFDIRRDKAVVCMFALTPDQKVVIAKQYRPGQERVLWELPGGIVDADETPEQAAKRELLEETGYSGSFKHLASSPNDCYSTLVRHHFVVKDARLIQDQQLGKHEFVEVVLAPLDQFKQILHAGELTDSETAYRALEHLKLH